MRPPGTAAPAGRAGQAPANLPQPSCLACSLTPLPGHPGSQLPPKSPPLRPQLPGDPVLGSPQGPGCAALPPGTQARPRPVALTQGCSEVLARRGCASEGLSSRLSSAGLPPAPCLCLPPSREEPCCLATIVRRPDCWAALPAPVSTPPSRRGRRLGLSHWGPSTWRTGAPVAAQAAPLGSEGQAWARTLTTRRRPGAW